MERIQPKKKSDQRTRRTRPLPQGLVRRHLPPVHTLTRRTHPSTQVEAGADPEGKQDLT